VKSIALAFGPSLAQALISALLLTVAWGALRSRAQLDAENPHAAERHRRFVSATAPALLVLAACVNVTFLLVASAMWNITTASGPAIIALSAAPSLLGTAALPATILRTGRGGSQL
jgi:uncharacterized membrane protein